MRPGILVDKVGCCSTPRKSSLLGQIGVESVRVLSCWCHRYATRTIPLNLQSVNHRNTLGNVIHTNETLMKKLFILFGTFCVLTVQTPAQVGSVIRTNLTDLLIDRYSLGTEFFLQHQFSLGLDVDYISEEVFLGSDHPRYILGNSEKRGFIVEPQFRWYFGEVVGQRAYVSASGFFGYASYSWTDEGNESIMSPPEWVAAGSSLHLGHQQRIRRFLLDAYLGVTWAQNRGMGIFHEERALFPQPDGFRMSGGLRFGFYARKSR